MKRDEPRLISFSLFKGLFILYELGIKIDIRITSAMEQSLTAFGISCKHKVKITAFTLKVFCKDRGVLFIIADDCGTCVAAAPVVTESALIYQYISGINDRREHLGYCIRKYRFFSGRSTLKRTGDAACFFVFGNFNSA